MTEAETLFLEDPRIGKVTWTPSNVVALGVFGHFLEGTDEEAERKRLMEEIVEDFTYMVTSFMDLLSTFALMYVALTDERFTEEVRMMTLEAARGSIESNLEAITTSLAEIESTYFTDLGEEM